MEKIFQNNSCRFCRKEYSNEKKSKEPRLNLFKNKFNHKSLVTTLEGLGVFVKENSLYSDTICRPCFNKIKILENAQLIKEKWIKLMNDQSSKRPRDDIDTIEDEGQSKKIRSESMETPVTIVLFYLLFVITFLKFGIHILSIYYFHLPL